MFCKFCGKQISPAAHECPFCGEAQAARSGGNGFRDILGPQSIPVQGTAEIPPAPAKPAGAAPERQLERAEKRLKKYTARGLTVTGMVCVLLTVVCLAVSTFLLSRGAEASAERAETAVQSISAQLEQLQLQLSHIQQTQPPVIEYTVPATAPTQPEDDFFFSQPEDALLADGQAVFSVRFPESDVPPEVIWEYYADGQWNEITSEMSDFQIETQSTGSALRVSAREGLEKLKFRCRAGEHCSSEAAVIFPGP